MRCDHRAPQPERRGACLAGMACAGAGDVAGVDRVSARNATFVEALRKRVSGTVREVEPVGRYSTYRIGGPATVLLPKTAEDVAAALRLAAEEGISWFAVGLGSNILLPDEGLDALVIRMGKGLDRIQQEQD